MLYEDMPRDELKVFAEGFDSLDYLVSLFVLYIAGVDGDYLVTVGLVYSGDNFAGSLVLGECGLDFHAIVVGIVHADDGFDF